MKPAASLSIIMKSVVVLNLSQMHYTRLRVHSQSNSTTAEETLDKKRTVCMEVGGTLKDFSSVHLEKARTGASVPGLWITCVWKVA